MTSFWNSMIKVWLKEIRESDEPFKLISTPRALGDNWLYEQWKEACPELGGSIGDTSEGTISIKAGSGLIADQNRIEFYPAKIKFDGDWERIPLPVSLAGFALKEEGMYNRLVEVFFVHRVRKDIKHAKPFVITDRESVDADEVARLKAALSDSAPPDLKDTLDDYVIFVREIGRWPIED